MVARLDEIKDQETLLKAYAKIHKKCNLIGAKFDMTEDIKTTLWKSADKLRAQMDAAEYKHIVLGLIFLKYISDKFGAQQEKIRQMVSDPSSDYFISEEPDDYQSELEERDYYIQDNVFWVPQYARWEKLRAQAKQSDIGSIIDNAMTSIENENSSAPR